VAVPYSFDATPWANIPAVTTARFVFWITNPSLAMYFAMNQQCRGVSAGMLAFEAESSYSSIQVWRMDPYEFCPIDPLTGVRRCPEDASATFRTLPGFISGTGSMSTVCEQYFLVVAPTISYINDYNLAITVLNTTFANVNTQTLRPFNESKARSVTCRQLPRLEIHCHFRRRKDLPLLVLHPKMRDDALVQFVQQMHTILTTPGVGTQKAHALEKPRLVALVRASDFEHLFAVLGRQIRSQFEQSIQIARQVASDLIYLISGQDVRVLKLQRERFVHVARDVAHCLHIGRVHHGRFFWFFYLYFLELHDHK